MTCAKNQVALRARNQWSRFTLSMHTVMGGWGDGKAGGGLVLGRVRWVSIVVVRG